MLINGLPGDCIHADDRGLAYGDGVFRTLRLQNGQPRLWSLHYNKLRYDCATLGLDCPDEMVLRHELGRLSHNHAECVAKIIITRGRGERGYARPTAGGHTRIINCQPLPVYPPEFYSAGIVTGICRIKLGRQPALAGIKHLNRLENVLAATECQAVGWAEGLLEDEGGEIIGGTRSNLFLVRNGILFTPDLTRCGVAGVQRDRVIAWASRHKIECKILPLRREDLQQADEIFLVNSVFGLWPIRELPGYYRVTHPVATQIRQWLDSDET